MRAGAELVAKGVFRPAVRTYEALGIYHRMHRVLRLIPGFDGRPNRDFGGYVPTARDVVVVTYPKSGTNWSLQICHQLAHGGRGDFEHIHDVVPWPEGYRIGRALIDGDDGRGAFRTVKTHLPFADLPFPAEPPDGGGGAKWIYIARDPKEVFVSAYHFVRDLAFGPAMPGVEAWLQTWLRGMSNFGSWPAHVAGGWAARGRPDVLWLTYRGMTADPPAAVDRIAAFCGVTPTTEERDRVLHLSSRSHMKSIDHRFHPGVRTPWAPAEQRLVRDGRAGVSSEMLTPDQQRRLDGYCRGELRRLGCDMDYDAVFGPP